MPIFGVKIIYYFLSIAGLQKKKTWIQLKWLKILPRFDFCKKNLFNVKMWSKIQFVLVVEKVILIVFANQETMFLQVI